MKKAIFLILILLSFLGVSAQNLYELTFGSDTTIEVVTWNIEHFPKNGQTTLNYVKQIIENIDADIFAFQEISDTTSFKQMLAQLPQYAYYFKSSWYAGLAYIYKPEVIQINNIYHIFTTSPYWSPFPRSPLVMDLTYLNINYIVINNHFKCCGDGTLDLTNSGDEETRRYRASNLLKDYIDTYFPDKRVILTGDLNDDIADSQQNNVFASFINDSQNYLFTDMDIANGSSTNWSYPTWPSHLDHILITNELFDDFQNDVSEINVIKVDGFLPGGWYEYDQNISDHRPVALKIYQEENIGIPQLSGIETIFENYPNPFSDYTLFNFTALKSDSEIEIFDMQGKVLDIIYLSKGQTSFRYDSGKLNTGLYFAKLTSKDEILTIKMLLK